MDSFNFEPEVKSRSFYMKYTLQTFPSLARFLIVLVAFQTFALNFSHMCTCSNCVVIHYSWISLVRKNYEIDKACLELETEINQLRATQYVQYIICSLHCDVFNVFLQGWKQCTAYRNMMCTCIFITT